MHKLVWLAGSWLLLTIAPVQAVLLSPADRVRITVVDAEELSGDYIIRGDGTISLNEFGPVPAAGSDEQALALRVQQLLQRYLKRPVVAVRLQAAGPISVIVTGAVYRPGPVLLAGTTANTIAPPIQPIGAGVGATGGLVLGSVAPTLAPATDGQGDLGAIRTLATAIKAAGGIQPNADLERISLTRRGLTQEFNVLSSLEGQDSGDSLQEPLVAGDRIFVPTRTKLLAAAISRSQLAPDQIQVSVSGMNLPRAGQIFLSPGARLIDALTVAGATGGGFIGSGRSVTLSRIDLGSGQRVQTSLGLDQAVQAESPLLLQGDAIYVTEGFTSNFFEVLGRLTPLAFFFSLFK